MDTGQGMTINRRAFLKGGAAATAGLALAAASLPALAQGAGLATEFVSTFDFALNPPDVVGPAPGGFRQIVSVREGTASGPKINGTFLAGGGDWIRVRGDGVFELDVRATLRLDDDQLAYVTYGGIAAIAEDVFGRIVGGEEVDGSEYYMRVTPRLETASEQYAWLNSALFVATARLGPGLASVTYQVYQIL